jgi:hypothetical protein
MKRSEILRVVEGIICNDRQDTHGNPENTFALIATYWETYLRMHISDHDVAVLMALFKIARLQVNPQHQDNILDGIGYLAIAGELIDKPGTDDLLNFR